MYFFKKYGSWLIFLGIHMVLINSKNDVQMGHTEEYNTKFLLLPTLSVPFLLTLLLYSAAVFVLFGDFGSFQ